MPLRRIPFQVVFVLFVPLLKSINLRVSLFLVRLVLIEKLRINFDKAPKFVPTTLSQNYKRRAAASLMRTLTSFTVPPV